MVQLNASLLQELEGTTQEMSATTVRFLRSENGRPASWRGGESYAAPVEVFPSETKHILKMFHLPCPERHQRSGFLAALGLGTLPVRDKPFAAAPSEAVRGLLTLRDQSTLEVLGNLAPFVEGERFGDLLRAGESPSYRARLSLARQLAMAVEVLENGELVHGDLSADNIMIVDPLTDTPKLRLIDFDGFYHPSVPPVPYAADQVGGRAWGTPGYRAMAFRRAPNMIVKSDRFAMAALIAELLLLTPEDTETVLGRETLLSQRDIDEHRELRIAADIEERCPEIFALLREAWVAPEPKAGPSPKRFRHVLDKLSLGRGERPVMRGEEDRFIDDLGMPFLVLARCADREDKRLKLPRPTGTFYPANPGLSWLSYEVNGPEIRLWGKLPWGSSAPIPLFVRFGGAGADAVQFDDTIHVTAQVGDVIHWDDVQLYLS